MCRLYDFPPHLLLPEKTKLKDTEYPLVSRLLHGPCEKIARIFIMEKDLGEEITYDVSILYISKFTIGNLANLHSGVQI